MPLVDGTPTYPALFPRQSGCVVCQDGSPTCPSCPSGQECQVTVPLDCTQCPQAYCAASSTTATSSSSTKPSSKASAGTIAGSVLGGVALIALVCVATYFAWKHFVKNKRGQFQQGGWEDGGEYAATGEKAFNQRRDQRASTGRNSIASTVLTRASNIIQIAYIPGVTNRATPTSPTLLVPPVPPIPIQVSSHAGTPSSTDDQHFFVPGDLRDSTCSGVSGYTDRNSYGRTSYAPRSSVASTIYGKAGVVVTPAQTGMRAKAAMVSVKSVGSGNSSDDKTPPMPSLDKARYPDKKGGASPTGSTFSVGSTFLNNATSANTATAVRAQVVRVGSNLKQSSTLSLSSNEEGGKSGSKAPEALPPPDSPFADPPAKGDRDSSHTLSAVIEEATRRASQTQSQPRGASPFGDEHAMHDDK